MGDRSKKNIGDKGEGIAAEWLTEQGFQILERNWRCGRYETDIIATRDGRLHFIEVKTKRSGRYGLPEMQVDRRKLNRMIASGTEFIRLHPGWKWIRFDIIAIQLFTNAPARIDHIQDLY